MESVQDQLTGCKGVSLLETMLAATVLAIGICGVMSSMVTTRQYMNFNREEDLAINVARLKLAEIELLQTPTSFSTIFTTYNRTTTPLNTSDPNLTINGGTVTVYFPTDSTGTKLVETLPTPVTDPNLSFAGVMPLDLNGDHTIDAATVDHSSDAKLLMLPVTIRVQWYSQKTKVARTMEFHSMLYPRHQQ